MALLVFIVLVILVLYGSFKMSSLVQICQILCSFLLGMRSLNILSNVLDLIIYQYCISLYRIYLIYLYINAYICILCTCVFLSEYQSSMYISIGYVIFIMVYILKDVHKAFVSLAECCSVELYLLVCFYFWAVSLCLTYTRAFFDPHRHSLPPIIPSSRCIRLPALGRLPLVLCFNIYFIW